MQKLSHPRDFPHPFTSRISPPAILLESASTSVYLINRLPTKTLHMQSPSHKLYKKPPSLHLKTFSCLCYPPWNAYTRHHKLDPKSSSCIFLGYSIDHKGFHCFDPTNSRLIISLHMRFYEHEFTMATNPNPTPSPKISIIDNLIHHPISSNFYPNHSTSSHLDRRSTPPPTSSPTITTLAVLPPHPKTPTSNINAATPNPHPHHCPPLLNLPLLQTLPHIPQPHTLHPFNPTNDPHPPIPCKPDQNRQQTLFSTSPSPPMTHSHITKPTPSPTGNNPWSLKSLLSKINTLRILSPNHPTTLSLDSNGHTKLNSTPMAQYQDTKRVW